MVEGEVFIVDMRKSTAEASENAEQGEKVVD